MGSWEDYDRLRDEIGDLKRKISAFRRQIDEKERRCEELRGELSVSRPIEYRAPAEAIAVTADPGDPEIIVEADQPVLVPSYIAETANFAASLGRPVRAEDVAKQFQIDTASASARLSKAATYYHLLQRVGRGQYLAMSEGG